MRLANSFLCQWQSTNAFHVSGGQKLAGSDDQGYFLEVDLQLIQKVFPFGPSLILLKTYNCCSGFFEWSFVDQMDATLCVQKVLNLKRKWSVQSDTTYGTKHTLE